MNKPSFFYPHDADPDIFREALAHSEAATGFTATLIEKDYYCSLILQYLFGSDTSLIFKGGTSLSKIHADFYRLSEDLDFVIPVHWNTSRRHRRNEIEPIKLRVNEISNVVPGFTVLYLIAINEVLPNSLLSIMSIALRTKGCSQLR